MVTGSKELIRDINQRLVLETIISAGGISRADVAKELGLTKATVSAIVSDLIDRELVLETGAADTSFGRKPIILQFNAEAGIAVCIDVSATGIYAMCTNLAGRRALLREAGTPGDNDGIAAVCIRLVEDLLREGPETPHGLIGITVAIHGAVKNNRIVFAPYYEHVAELDFEQVLGERFGVPVLLENEADLSAVGENVFFCHADNMVNISVHAGVGAGVILDGKLYTGFSGNAGEIGHTIVEVDGRPCPCGNRGCLEQYVSERVLLKEFCEKKGLASVTVDEFFEYVVARDPDAAEIMDQFVKYMSVCVNNTLNTFNPDVVVINSLFTAYSPRVVKRIESRLKSRVNRYIKIMPSGLQDVSILLGGICMAVSNFLQVATLHMPEN